MHADQASVRVATPQAGGAGARIAVPFGIPVALAVMVGAIIVVAVAATVSHVNESALANCASAAAAASAARGERSASRSHRPRPARPGGGRERGVDREPERDATAPAVNPEAGRPDLAEATPVDPTGAAISLTQTPAEAADR